MDLCRFSADGKRLFTRIFPGSDAFYGEGSITAWDVSSGKMLYGFEYPIHGVDFLDTVNCIAFSPDDRRIVTAANCPDSPQIWDALIGKMENKLAPQCAATVVFSPDGGKVLIGNAEGTATLWDVFSGKLLHAFKGHAFILSSVAFSPKGRRILTAGGNDGTAKLWDASTGEFLHNFSCMKGVQSLAFSPDGETMLIGADGTVELWKTLSKEEELAEKIREVQ